MSEILEIRESCKSPNQLLESKTFKRYLNIYKNIPSCKNLDKNGHFKSPEELRHNFIKLIGDTASSDIISMCGSGITACHNILALEISGIKNVSLFVGSWSEWITDKSRPIAKIDE